MTFLEACERRDAIQARVDAASAALGAFPSGRMGLTPDDVKASPAWRAAKATYEAAHRDLRTFNAWLVPTFRAELRTQRAARVPMVGANA